MIKPQMDQELFDAAMKVIDSIEGKLLRSERNRTDEEVLGRELADAYRSWQTLIISRHTSDTASDEAVEIDDVKLDGRRHNRPVRPAKGHPWRGTAKR